MGTANHMGFIVAAYAATVVIVGALIAWVTLDYRAQRRPRENMNIGRTWRVKERYSFNLRMEFTNVFNRAFWGDPSSTALTNAKQPLVYLPNGNTSSGFGRVNTTAPSAFGSVYNLQPRQGVLVGRFTF